MATIDWPTGAGFRAATFATELDVAASRYRAFFTGNTERTSHLADRLRCTVTLPPVVGMLEAGQRSGFLNALRSTGDWVRFGMPHRQAPLGDMAGSPTVAAAAAAGARSVLVTGCYGTNRLQNPSFERPALAPWAPGAGSHTGVRSSAVVVVSGNSLQLVNAAAGQDAYYKQTVPCLPSTTYTLTAFVNVASITAGALNNRAVLAFYHDGFGGGTGYAEDVTLTAAHALNSWTLKVLTVTTGPAAAYLDVLLYAPQGTVYWDAIQLTQGAAALPTFVDAPTLQPGDFVGVGGNLLEVAYPGTSRDSSDNVVVPLVAPLPKALAGGEAVVLAAPTGVWELEDAGLQLDYSPGAVQAGVALPFRQVAV